MLNIPLSYNTKATKSAKQHLDVTPNRQPGMIHIDLSTTSCMAGQQNSSGNHGTTHSPTTCLLNHKPNISPGLLQLTLAQLLVLLSDFDQHSIRTVSGGLPPAPQILQSMHLTVSTLEHGQQGLTTLAQNTSSRLHRSILTRPRPMAPRIHSAIKLPHAVCASCVHAYTPSSEVKPFTQQAATQLTS